MHGEGTGVGGVGDFFETISEPFFKPFHPKLLCSVVTVAAAKGKKLFRRQRQHG